MSMVTALLGRLVVGVEPDEEETGLADEGQKPVVRVYIDARYKGHYVLAAGADAKRLYNDGNWGDSMGHVFIDVPQGTPVYQEHRIVPGSHERAGGAECVCGQAFDSWNEKCSSQMQAEATQVASPVEPEL